MYRSGFANSSPMPAASAVFTDGPGKLYDKTTIQPVNWHERVGGGGWEKGVARQR